MYHKLLKLFKANKCNIVQLKKISTKTNPNVGYQNIVKIWSFVKDEKIRLAGAVGFLFISSGVTLTVPFIMGKLIDFISKENISRDRFQSLFKHIPFIKDQNIESNVNNTKDTNVFKYGSLIVIFFIIGGFANFCRFYLIQTAGQRIIYNIRNKLYSSLMHKSVAFFDKNKSGDLLSRITADTTVVGEGLSNNVSNGLRSVLQAVMGTTMMVYVSPQLTGVAMLILPPFVAVTLIFGRYIRKVSNGVQKLLALSTERADESISAIRTVKVFGKEFKEISDYQMTTSAVLNKAYQEALLRGAFFGLVGMSGNILIVALLFYGGSLISTEQLTIGGLSSFLLYAAYASVSVGGIGSFYTELMKTAGAGSRIWQLLDDIPRENRNCNISQSNSVRSLSEFGDIKFEDVSFSYPSRPDNKVLNDFTLCLPKGKMTALVGKSGCGKSSVSSLLLNFYPINGGKLTVNGQSLTDINVVEWNERVTAVLQDSVLFSCSIAENIAYGSKSNIGMADIERIADKCQVMEFVRDLPDGLDTKIGERGILLSGGQRQRIAIARALIADPSLIIMDEATSALDAKNEWFVQRAINEIAQGRTVLTISHRLALLRSADQIAVVKDGKVVQLGTFDNLENKSLKYIYGDYF